MANTLSFKILFSFYFYAASKKIESVARERVAKSGIVYQDSSVAAVRNLTSNPTSFVEISWLGLVH